MVIPLGKIYNPLQWSSAPCRADVALEVLALGWRNEANLIRALRLDSFIGGWLDGARRSGKS
ncbi:MAG: hypothetical protein EBU28_02860 [Gammaproteobacteria bacterium]|nr:hypothetical protein [Gammaproteobacteria bacterium]